MMFIKSVHKKVWPGVLEHISQHISVLQLEIEEGMEK